ncbi:hypothetical protein LguiB_018715 [Lonicera macranthoides]
MATTTDVVLQLAIILFTLALFFAINKFPKQTLAKLRSKGRSTAQSHRHFVQGAHLLARARSTRNQATAHGLAKGAVGEADKALAIEPRDAGSHILKALALDLMGHKSSALKSLDVALSPAAAWSLSERDRGDALFRRAELQVAVNRRRRLESAVADLVESVRLVRDNGKAFGLLGQCYEMKGEREEARKAFEEALRVEPGLVSARDGLARLGS